MLFPIQWMPKVSDFVAFTLKYKYFTYKKNGLKQRSICSFNETQIVLDASKGQNLCFRFIGRFMLGVVLRDNKEPICYKTPKSAKRVSCFRHCWCSSLWYFQVNFCKLRLSLENIDPLHMFCINAWRFDRGKWQGCYP